MIEIRGTGKAVTMTSLCVGLLLAAIGDATAQETPRDITECARIEDSKLRLACYDSFARKPGPAASSAASKRQTEAPERKAEPVPVPVSPAVPAAPAQAMPAERRTFDSPPPQPQIRAVKPELTEREAFGSPPKTREERREELNSIAVVISKGRQNHLGKWSILTEDGQIWRQTGKTKLRIRGFPARATIRKASLGSFFLRLEDGGPSIRVTRDK